MCVTSKKKKTPKVIPMCRYASQATQNYPLRPTLKISMFVNYYTPGGNKVRKSSF